MKYPESYLGIEVSDSIDRTNPHYRRARTAARISRAGLVATVAGITYGAYDFFIKYSNPNVPALTGSVLADMLTFSLYSGGAAISIHQIDRAEDESQLSFQPPTE